MRKLVILVVLVVVGLVAYRAYQARQAPLAVYKSFADALARGRPDIARRFAVEDIEGLERAERYSLSKQVPAQSILGMSYEVESRTSSADGNEVTLRVIQRISYNPPGAESALRGSMAASFRHDVVLRRVAEGWEVASCESEFLGADETR